MKNNTPILTQSEEEKAPWNEKTKIIEVTISQTLSRNAEIEVPLDFDKFNNEILEEMVRSQIELPSDAIQNDEWIVDDFCII